MPLTPGTRLGPYEIVAPVGAGGMGEVYRARDRRLDRTVALKVLQPGLAGSAEQQARFEREARAAGGLQHPHICVLHDVGRDGGFQYLVMEYLEGETLAARLRRGPLPLGELVKVGGQIADALERAHRAGIVHRDLKPANVMLTPAGAKLLDFGLAKPQAAGVGAGLAPSDVPSFSATLAPTELHSPVTQAGAVVGTVQYMSPEQIRGLTADARSDIFALGCVLYECATGQRAFPGATHLSVAAAILEKQPTPMGELQRLTPAGLELAVERCLRKVPEERWQSAADVQWALLWAGAAPAPVAVAGRGGWWPSLTGAVVAALAAAALWALWPRTAAPRLLAELPAPSATHFSFGGIDAGSPALSPDGRQVAFVAEGAGGRRHLWVQALDQPQARELAGTDNAMLPFWSPDGGDLGYFAADDYNLAGRLMLINLANGQTRTVAFAPIGRGGSWAADGTILFAANSDSGIDRVPAAGGRPQTVALLAPPFTSLRYPYWLPDGRHFLYMALSHDDSSRDMIYWASLDGQTRPLVHSTTAAIYSAGQLLYSSQGTLMAQPLDASTGALGGTAVPVAHAVFEDDVTWRPAYSAAANGVLVYASGGAGNEQLAWLDRNGRALATLPAFRGAAFSAALAPDGRRLALSLDQGLQDIWIVTPEGGRSRLTFGPVSNNMMRWSPDGEQLVYTSKGEADAMLQRRPANGGGAASLVLAKAGLVIALAGGWTPEQRQLLVLRHHADHTFDLAALPMPEGQPARPVVAATSDALDLPRLSPDGRWASYLAGQPGQLPDLYLVPFAGGGAKWQVTTQGVETYFWVKGGKELDVLDGSGHLLAIPVTVTGGAPAFGAPTTLAGSFPRLLAASADGERFLGVFHPDDQQRLRVDSNWRRALASH